MGGRHAPAFATGIEVEPEERTKDLFHLLLETFGISRDRPANHKNHLFRPPLGLAWLLDRRGRRARRSDYGRLVPSASVRHDWNHYT